ncbi:MAG: nucleotidyltransferase domain-containing protein [Negativicutes bacterium]|nr:nucleotidyltransferase domain-containing protein [Negativicutes bacterium]
MPAEENIPLINKLMDFFATKEEVLFAWLFGSYASGRNNRHSDVDIAIYVKETGLLLDLDWYLSVKADLMALTKREVDLILLNTAKPLVKHVANRKKVVLLSRAPLFEAEYSLRVLKEYNDTRYWARRSRQRLLGG